MKLNQLVGRVLLGILFLSAFSFSAANAQNAGSIQGTVTDAQSGDPIPGVQLILQSIKIGAVSGLDGMFEIRNVPPGQYVIEARFL